MKITFVDTIAFDYDLDTPLNHPLGAGNSAICYLAKELAKLGHEVTIYNGTSKASEGHGVAVRNINELAACGVILADPAPMLNNQDIVVVCSGACGVRMRAAGVKPPLILWTQHAPDQPAVQPLRQPVERYAFDGVAYVSEWQKKLYEATFGMPPDRGQVLPNGISTAFEKIEPKAPWYVTGTAPRLFYTSTPFRGLTQLLTSWPIIRKAYPAAFLHVFSSMKTYQKPDDDFECLYDYCDYLPNVQYHGSVGQARLADLLATYDVLAYPSTFPEAQCVSMIEAMSTGAEIFTTTLGALPEVAKGHARMCDLGDATARRFAEMVIEGLRECEANPEVAQMEREDRIFYIHEHFVWSKIALKWDAWLKKFAKH